MPWSNQPNAERSRRSAELGATSPDRWPKWAVAVKQLAATEDAGVGDTLRRLFAKVGGEQFKRTARVLGVPCGCAARQVEYNQRFPY